MDKRIFVICMLLLLPTQAWLSGWDYQKAINVTTASNNTNYPLNINVSYETGMDAGFRDIRITDSNDTLLDYVIVYKVNSSYSDVWFKGNWSYFNGTQAYLYYGKSGTTDASNGSQVFTYYDDFNDGINNDWTYDTPSLWTEMNGYLNQSGAGDFAYLTSTPTYTNVKIITYITVSGSDNFPSVQTRYDANNDRVYFIMRQPDSEWRIYDGTSGLLGSSSYTIADGTYKVIAKSVGTNHTLFIDDLARIVVTTTNSQDAGQGKLWTTGTSTKYDFYAVIDNAIQNEPTSVIGTEKSDIRILFSLNPTVVNVSTNVSFTGSNYTSFWWDIDNGNTSYYTAVPYVFHSYTSSGTYTLNVTAYDGANITKSAVLTVNEPLYNTTITISDYLPFITTAPTTALSYSTINGSGTLNSSWEITLPNSTKETYVNQTSFAFDNRVQGTHSVTLTVCDLVGDACVTDSDSFHTWNVTGGRSDIVAFNQTSRLLAQLFVGDTITLSSADSLTWNYSGELTTGTSAEFALNDSYAYWNDADYLHFNVSISNTWGSYSATSWFTMIAGNYTVTQGGSYGSNLYCLVGGKMYNSTSQLTNSTSWSGILETSAGATHNKESSISTTDNALNISLWMNATPVISDITLDGTIIYSAGGYAERTYAFQSANIPLTQTCTVANGKYISFYTDLTSDTSTITFTVLQGGTALPNALVKVQEFDTSWYTVASAITDTNGQVQFELGLCPTFYKFIVEQGGTILFTEKTCLKSTARTINVPSEISESYQIYQNVSTYCGWDNTTNILACTLSDPTGKTVVAELNVYPAFSSTSVCSESQASTTTTLVCDLSDQVDSDYAYELKITTASDSYLVDFGTVTKGAEAGISVDGPIIALYLIMLLIFSVRLSPEALIGFATLSVIILRSMRILSFPYSAFSWLLALALAGIVTLVKKDGK